MCECCHYVFTISRLSQPTDVAVWDTVIENGVTPTQIRQRSKRKKKKKERENYTNVQLNVSFPSWLFTRNLQIWIKKIPLRRFFFSDQRKTLFILFYFFSFWEKYRWKGLNVWSNCTMWFPLSWVQVSDPYIKVPIIDLCFCFW